MGVPVTNIEGYMPPTLKLDNSDFLNPFIPAFSQKTVQVFEEVKPGKEIFELKDAYQKMQNIVNTLQELKTSLSTAEKYETLNKFLSLIGIAAAIALISAGIVGAAVFATAILPVLALPFGIAGLFVAAVGARFAFTDVSRLYKMLSQTNVDAIKNYQTQLQKYLVLNEDELREEIENKIAEWKMKAQQSDVKKGLDEDIQILEKALLELDDLVKFYSENESVSF